MEIGTIKKIRFEDLIEFLNKNLYKIITIEILLNEKKILIKLEENSNKEYFECEFKGKSVKDVYVMIYNFSMEKLQKDGFYLAEKSDVFGRIIFYRFIKFCKKHEYVKNLYLIYENDENKMLQEMKEMVDDYLKCEECLHTHIAHARLEDVIIIEFKGFDRIYL